MAVATANTISSTDLDALRAELRAFEAQNPEPSRNLEKIDWHQVVNSCNDAFLAVDASGVLIEWSTNAELLFGWRRDEVLGKTLEETILPSDPEQGKPGGLRLLAVDPAKGRRLEVTAKTRNGEDLPAEVSVTAMRRGSSFVFNAFVHDISRRRELQTQLAHAQKLESIGQLSAGIAHEINTPTQYVGDNTRFVQESIEDLIRVLESYEKLAEAVRSNGDTNKALEQAEALSEEADVAYLKEELGLAIEQSLEGINSVAKIVRAMKEFSHPGTTTKTSIDLAEAVSNTITVATNEWKYVAEIETDYDRSLPPVPCLPGDLNQVVLNLVVNAAHAIGDVVENGEKGVIRVSTHRDGEEAVLEVSDTGCGISPEMVGKVFDPFFTTKEVGVGTGQGLAIARSVIVDKHTGTISVESEVGKGTTFTVRLPLEEGSKDSSIDPELV